MMNYNWIYWGIKKVHFLLLFLIRMILLILLWQLCILSCLICYVKEQMMFTMGGFLIM